jgi:predicted O-methyltransferase YrrM
MLAIRRHPAFIDTLGKASSAWTRLVHHRQNAREMAKLVGPGESIALAAATVVQNGAIERHRRAMLQDRSALAPDDMGGPYDVGQTVSDACAVSKKRIAAEFLAALARVAAPRNAIELGTNVGVSAAYIATEMQAGILTTFEASPARIALAVRMHQSLGLSNVQYVQGLFQDTLPAALRKLGQIDFAFIDGHHQYQPTLDYFELIYPYMSPGSIIVCDDIRWSDGMRKAWSELGQDKRFSIVADFYKVGVCVIGDGSKERIAAGPIRLF